MSHEPNPTTGQAILVLAAAVYVGLMVNSCAISGLATVIKAMNQ